MRRTLVRQGHQRGLFDSNACRELKSRPGEGNCRHRCLVPAHAALVIDRSTRGNSGLMTVASSRMARQWNESMGRHQSPSH